jgi:hypothetical protein
MSGYRQAFTDSHQLTPSRGAYSSLTLAGETQFFWPSEYIDPALAFYGVMEINVTATGAWFLLPDASAAGVGGGGIIVNVGAANPVTVMNFGATAQVTSIPPGQAAFVYSTDNTSPQGNWHALNVGGGVITPNLASQVGSGIQYYNGFLRSEIAPVRVSTGTFSITAVHRANLVENVTGATTWTLPDITAGTLGPNFYFTAANYGSGSITITPTNQTIAGQASLTLTAGQSCVLVADASSPGAETWRVCYLSQTASGGAVAGNIDLSAGGTVTLTGPQVATQIQSLIGALPSNTTVLYGATAGVWYVTNNTTGAHTVTLKATSGDPGVALAQGVSATITSNGTNLKFANSQGAGTVTQVNTALPLTGGPVTTTGTVALTNSGVIAGNYGGTNQAVQLAIDQYGRVLSAENTTPFLATGGTITGTLTVQGLVTEQQTTGLQAAFNQVLIADPANAILEIKCTSTAVSAGDVTFSALAQGAFINNNNSNSTFTYSIAGTPTIQIAQGGITWGITPITWEVGGIGGTPVSTLSNLAWTWGNDSNAGSIIGGHEGVRINHADHTMGSYVAAGQNLALGAGVTGGSSPLFFLSFYYGTISQPSIGSITSNGSQIFLNNATVSPPASDYRIKEVRGESQFDLGAVLDRLPIYDGTTILDAEGTTPYTILLAHELQNLAPQFVVGEKDAKLPGGGALLQRVRYDELLVAVLKYLKDQRDAARSANDDHR